MAHRASRIARVTRSLVLIFGRDTCPYTQWGRDDHLSLAVPFEYVNVRKHPAELERMLGLS